MAPPRDASRRRSPPAHHARLNPRSALENPTPISRFHCASVPAVDDIHPNFPVFIRRIHPLLPNVAIWQRCDNGVLGIIGPISGKNEEGTTSDTSGQGPVWIPHVGCPLALTHRCRHHYRVWGPRVWPPPLSESFRAGLHYGGEGIRLVKNAWPRHGYLRQMVDVPKRN